MNPVLFVVDAFTSELFRGNPAAVCLLADSLSIELMQSIAAEMNLSETAFLRKIEDGYSLRWFTPTVEVDLCGHATLASAHILWELGVLAKEETAKLSTRSGWLICKRRSSGWIEMDFPAMSTTACTIPNGLVESMGCELVNCETNGTDYIVEVTSEVQLRSLKPNMSTLAKLPVRGIIVTCMSQSSDYDFASRFFAPAVGVNEDPVTGSAHCALGPYWLRRLGKSNLTGFQASSRGGTVRLEVIGERVRLLGQAKTFSRVEVLTDLNA